MTISSRVASDGSSMKMNNKRFVLGLCLEFILSFDFRSLRLISFQYFFNEILKYFLINFSSVAKHMPTLHYNQQQQLTSSTNNNLHSISLSLTPSSHLTGLDKNAATTNSHLMSILNLSNKK